MEAQLSGVLQELRPCTQADVSRFSPTKDKAGVRQRAHLTAPLPRLRPLTSTFLTFLTAESKVTLILPPPPTLCCLWGWHHQVRGRLQPEELGPDDAQGAVSPTSSIRVIFMLSSISSTEYVLITKPSLGLAQRLY